MSLPWHIPLQNAPGFKDAKKAVIQKSLLTHYCNLNFNENPCEELQTGIMCDIGPQNKDTATIQRLIGAGMTIARLNAREIEQEESNQIIQSIRQAVYNYSAELEYVYPLAVVIDIKNPEIVTGWVKDKGALQIIQGESLRLTNDFNWKDCGTADCLYVAYNRLTDLQPDNVIYIESLDGGKIKLVISEVGDDSVDCIVASGGIIGPKMTVLINQVPRDTVVPEASGDSSDSLTCESAQQSFEHIGEQISWAIGIDVDAVLLPNVQMAIDVREVKDLLGEKGKHILVLACLETALGFENIDEIINEADGLFLDRNILSADLPIEKICIAQKIILAKCNRAGKPVICKAVINEQIPTLCVSDIVNLILDGTDCLALELHYESPLTKLKAITHDCVKMAEHCLAAAGVISRHAERILWQPRVYGKVELMTRPLDEPTKAICVSAVELAMRSRSVVIICLTNSGRTAKILSHAHPSCPIIAVTRACHTARQMRFWRGVRAVHYFEVARGSWLQEVEARIHTALDYCKVKRVIRAGDSYVVVTGSRRGVGYCDSVRLLYATTRDTVQLDANGA